MTSDLLYLFGLGFLCFNCDHYKEKCNLANWNYQQGSDINNVLFAYDVEKQSIFKEECTQIAVNSKRKYFDHGSFKPWCLTEAWCIIVPNSY